MKAIEAAENWWGYNKSTAVVGKMRDFRDVPELLRIHYDPYIEDNRTVLSGKCDPGWTLVGDTCYLYMGVPMNFSEAKSFCKKDNASLPYLMSNYYGVMEFLQSQQKGFDYYSRVWVQHLDMIGQCVVFINRRVERSPCDLLLPFLCEAGIVLFCGGIMFHIFFLHEEPIERLWIFLFHIFICFLNNILQIL